MTQVKKITKSNVADLYHICCPPQKEYARGKRESCTHFILKQRKGWRGVVVEEKGKVVGRAEFHPLEESFTAIACPPTVASPAVVSGSRAKGQAGGRREGKNLYFLPCI
ncbi:MAG: hypothetical protein AB1393_11305 [Candidatus Edwardsbacteria bacterium]